MTLLEIIAVTRVFGAGQRIVAAALHYDREIGQKELSNLHCQVKEQTVTAVYISRTFEPGKPSEKGCWVIVELDPENPAASTKRRKGQGRNAKLEVISAAIWVKTEENQNFRENTHTVNLVADQFVQAVFQIPDSDHVLAYNLYVPEKLEENRKYPLVLFLHDMGSCSEDVTAPLVQGNGASCWAEKEAQKRHPCFVVAPQYPEQGADDEFQVTWEMDATVKLLYDLSKNYPIDTNRIYGTGQSMGCMMLCEMNIRYPQLFGGCFLVAGQWNPETMSDLKDANLWVLVSEKDEKAFPIMGACMDEITEAGGKVTRGAIDGNAPLEYQNLTVRTLMGKGNHIFFTWYSGESALPSGQKMFPGAHHMGTWEKAYGLTAIRDWLFAQRKTPINFSCKHEVMLRNEDGSLSPMDEPYYEVKQVASGTWQILSDGDYFYLVEGDEKAILIDSGYGCGNVRSFCQSLTEKPLNEIANTHDHFDHTAYNSYFDMVYLSEETKELATLPFPSFSGITFPRDYQTKVVDQGDTISLGERELMVFKTPDHAAGSLCFLDSREGILFCGDELTMPFGKSLNGSVERFRGYLRKLQEHRGKIRLICGGPAVADAGLIDRLAKNMDYILEGHEGRRMEEPAESKKQMANKAVSEPVIYDRRLPHYPDRHQEKPEDRPFKRVMDYGGCSVIYDVRKIWEKPHKE